MEKIKLIENVRNVIRMKHYSIRTEETYISWIKRYIFFHNKRHPSEMNTKGARCLRSIPNTRALTFEEHPGKVGIRGAVLRPRWKIKGIKAGDLKRAMLEEHH